MLLSGILLPNATRYNVMPLSDSTRPFSQRHSIHGTGMPSIMAYNVTFLTVPLYPRNIILALMSTGEAYLADLRKEHRSRVELCEVLDDSEDDGHNRNRLDNYFWSLFS